MPDLEIVDATPEGDSPNPSEQYDSSPDLPEKPQADGLGFLLDCKDEKKVSKHVYKTLWMSQDKLQKNRLAMWEVNEERRAGNPHVRLKKQIDEDVYTVYYPRGTENAPPSLNKTDDLCTKVVSQLLVDPPRAECIPSSDEDKDRDAADFSEKVLEELMSESGIQGNNLVRRAVDLACTYWSAFIIPYTDPFGGGWRPKEIMASMQATTVDDALFLEGQAQPEPYVIRYVSKDGSLVDDPAEADVEWLPKVRAKVTTGKNVRLFPQTCESILDAEAAIHAEFLPMSELRARYESIREMSAEDQQKLCSFRPEGWENLLPKGMKPENDQNESRDKSKEPPDDTLALVFTTVYRSTPVYRKGAYVVTGGDTFVIERFPWTMEIEQDKKVHEFPMDIPVAQFRQFADTSPTRDPLGRGLVDKVGDGDPILAMAIGAMIEYLPKALNPHLFIPIGSGIDSKSLQLPRGTPIPYMGQAGQPVYETLAPFPPEVLELYDRINSRMNSTSGLEEAAQGVSSPEVRSGTHAMRIIEQAKVAITSPKEGMENGYVRLCRLLLQLVKKDYTQPQKLRLTGAGGRRKVREWTKADLGDTSDVKIRAGTSTMMSESAKKSVAQDEFELTSKIDPVGSLERYRRAVEGSVDPLLAINSDPPKEEVLDQIADWKEGPPEGWAPVQAPIDPITQQAAIDPATGQPLPPPADPQNPFVRRPHHLEQDVAQVRHKEMKRAMAQADFQRWPPEWQSLFVTEYEAMRQAAGVATVQEQQQAQQQQMAQQAEMQNAGKPDPNAQAQQEAEKQAMEQQSKMEERQFQVQDKAEERAFQQRQKEQELAVKHRELDLKEREMNAPVEVATAQAQEVIGSILPAVQQTVAEAISQAVSHLTQVQEQSLAEQAGLIQQATSPLAQELVNQRRTLAALSQAVQAPIVVPAEKPEAPVIKVEAPKAKRRTVKLKRNDDGSISGEVTEDGAKSATLNLKRDGKNELVGEVVPEPNGMQKIRRKGK